MKTPEKSTKPDAARQKKQLLALGGLSAVFAAVLAIQFGGGESAPEVAALTDQSAADPAAGATEEAPAEAGPVATPIPVAKNNSVLEAPAAETPAKRSPFSNFWSVAPTGGTAVTAVSAPTVTLNATMPGDASGLAVIDGQMHFVGDSIQGWALASVGPRSVTLRGPTGDAVVVEMPLLVGKVELPMGAGAKARLAGNEPGAAPAEPASDG